MRAIRLHEFGPAANLRLEDVDDPRPGPGQVRIAVRAAGVHLVDTALREGRSMGAAPPPELPAIPGREVAGVVEDVGPGVDTAWRGRRVVAHLGAGGSGGYAELAIAPATALHALPDALGDAAAVAMIGTGRTALVVLDAAALTAGDVVLVTSAAGGLGSLLVQAARRAGATVVGLAGGPAKVARAREHGATHAVDYAQPGWPDAVRAALGDRPVTAALDGVGGAVGRGVLELLGPGGRLLLFGLSSGDLTPLTARDLFARGLTVTVPIGRGLLDRPGGLRDLEDRALAAAAAGELTAAVHPPFALADAAAAHAALETRATAGKVVLVP